jgi:hypothetical protein
MNKHNKKEGNNLNCIDYPSWIMAFTTIVICLITAYYAYCAKKQVEATRDSIYQSQRAFVFISAMNSGQNIVNGKVKQYIVQADIQNTGNTVANNVKIWFKSGPNHNFIADGYPLPTSIIGPHSIYKSSYLFIPLEDMINLGKNKTPIYIWSRIEYRDMYKPERVHYCEQINLLELIRDPLEVVQTQDIPSVQFKLYSSHCTE